ncbi:hypothetical protein [Pseudoxanthomonas wuyuanensis]
MGLDFRVDQKKVRTPPSLAVSGRYAMAGDLFGSSRRKEAARPPGPQ